MNNNIYYNKINIEGRNGFRSIVFTFTGLEPVKALWHRVCKSMRTKLLCKTISTKTSQTALPPCFDRFKKHSQYLLSILLLILQMIFHIDNVTQFTNDRPIRLTQCCTQFKFPGVKILCVLYLHYNVAFSFKCMEIPETKRFIPKGFELGTTLS